MQRTYPRAPGRVTESAAAAIAVRTASPSFAPSASAAASAPLNASPAPVVSTASTCGAGMRSSASPSASSAPAGPIVTTTGAPVRLVSARAAASGSASPLSAAASGSFGVSTGPSASSSSGSGRAGAGWSTTCRSAARAARAAARTGASGTSSPISTTPPGSAPASAASTAAGVRSLLAPEATAIWFSPASSTAISATPVGAVTRATADTSTPSPARSATASSPRSSLPTAPTIRTVAPCRAAATAWFALLPPPWRSKVPPVTVSPGPGSVAARTTRSRLTEPTTYTSRAIGWDDAASVPPDEIRIDVELRWRDLDFLGHLNQAVYHELLEEGRGALFERLGVMEDGFFFVLARVELDHRREIRRHDDPVTVALRVEAVGRASVTLAHDIRLPDGTVAAEGRSVLVAWDRDARRSRALTDAERARLA